MRPKLSDVLTTEIRREIEDGVYGAAGRLPSENKLSQRFDVSRPIVREALRQLREEGLIHSRQGAGSFVSRHPAETAQAGVPEGPAPVHSIRDIRFVYDYRVALEGEIARAAAHNAGDEAVAEIRRKLDELQDAIHQGVIGVEQDFEFHLAIARATGNPHFVAALDLIRPHLKFAIDLARSFSSLGTAEHIAMVQEEHGAVFDAIARRDGEGAAAAMRRHILAARNRIFNGEYKS